MIFIIFWMTLLPFLVESFKNDVLMAQEEKLSDLLKTKLLLSGGRIIPIRVFYGEVNRENFNPGIGFYDFYDSNLEENRFLKIFRSPTVQMLYETRFDFSKWAYAASKTEKLVLITGDSQTGKTTALRHIEFMLGDQYSPTLSLYVDVPDVFELDTSNSITIEDIIKGAVHEDYVDLVKNMLEINPTKVKILLDGIDQVPPHTQEKILSTVSEFNRQGVHVIMTSNTDILPVLTAREMSPSTFHIPSTMSNDQFKMVMTNYWKKKLSILNNLEQQHRLYEYSKAIGILIEETPLPRSVSVARVLAEHALKPNLWKPFPTVSEYLEQREKFPRPERIIKLSNQMRLPKMHLYDQILKHHVLMMEAYGPQALNMILKSKSTQIGIELSAAVRLSNEFITNHGQYAFALLKFSNGVPVDFIHQEYKRYFAATYIMNCFATNTPLVASFREIISNAEHIFVLEFIDAAINNFHANKMTKTMSLAINTPKFAETVFDNLIQHRLDNLCAQMFKATGKENLKSYLNEKKTLQSKNKYSFGMLSEVRDVDARYYLPRKTPWQYSGTRVEMMVNLGMKKTQLAAERSGFRIDPNIRLIHAAKQSPRHFQRFLMKNGRRYPVDVLNTAMYESLESLGKNSLKILAKLRSLGAEPASVNKNGRTLLHVAAKYHNTEVLHAIYKMFNREQLVDVADGNGRTILIELLESAMPFNTYTVDGAWEAMLFLAKHVDLSCNRDLLERSSQELLDFSPKNQDIPEPYQKLFMCSKEFDSDRIAVVYTLENYIPLREIEVSPSVSSMRRKLLIKNCRKTMMEQMSSDTFANKRLKITDFMTISELVISHHDSWGTVDFNVYRKTIQELLLKEAALFNKFQVNRILTLIVKNTMSMSELTAMGNMIKTHVGLHIREFSSTLMHTIFSQRLHRQLPIAVSSKYEDIIVQSAYDLDENSAFYTPEEGSQNRDIFGNTDNGDSSLEVSGHACDNIW